MRARNSQIKPLKLRWSKAARGDMRAIFRYIEKENPIVASAFVADLYAKAASVAASGLTGVARSNVGRNLRAFPYRDRCFYFRIIEDHMVIVRVLHSKQDVTAVLFKD